MTGSRFRVLRRAASGAAALALMMALSACLPGIGGGDKASAPKGSNMLTGGEIETTALPPAGAAPAAAVAPAPAAQGQATEAKQVPAATDPASTPTDPAAQAPAAAPEAPPAPPPVPKSGVQLACEQAKGIWAISETGGANCVWTTRDSGKRCTKGSDCEGQCLARSGTCAPFKPMFGCSEILDDSGRRMTECLQ